MGNLCSTCEGKNQNLSISHSSMIPEKVIEAKFHQCIIRLSYGDLLKENSDAIVAIIDPSVAFNGHLCRQIMQQAGRSLINDISKIQQSKPNFEYGQVFHTHSGDLDFEFIFYAVLPPQWEAADEQQKVSRNSYTERSLDNLTQQMHSSHKNQQQFVFQCINEILKQAEDLGLNSVSFPVISAENIKASNSLTATIMIMAIKAFIEENNHALQHLQLINITILNQNMLSIFKWAFEKIIHGNPDNHLNVNDVKDENAQNQIPSEDKPSKKISVQSFHDYQHHESNSTNPESDYQRFGHGCKNQMHPTDIRLLRKESI